jgi:hypothetical protein
MTREQLVTAEGISMQDARRAADSRQTRSLEGDSPINAEVPDRSGFDGRAGGTDQPLT